MGRIVLSLCCLTLVVIAINTVSTRVDVGLSGVTRERAAVWHRWQPATCIPDHCFCETIKPGLIRQPVNTWSNLGFVWVGWLILTTAARDLARRQYAPDAGLMRTNPVYPALYGVAAILTGFGSMIYHASLTFFGQTIDVISMYLLTSAILFYGVGRLSRLENRTLLICYLTTNSALAYAVICWPVLRRYAFVVLLLAILATEITARLKRPSRMKGAYLGAAIVSALSGCAAWIIDVSHAICPSIAWLQGHALWHILMATAVGFIYFYHRSETLIQMK